MNDTAMNQSGAEQLLDDHGASIDMLEKKLTPLAKDDASRGRLQKAMADYRAAHATMANDVLRIVGTQK